MRLLLDECVPSKLRNDFQRHDVRTVQEMGWAGKKMESAVGGLDFLDLICACLSTTPITKPAEPRSN
jgi:hypothetical protein